MKKIRLFALLVCVPLAAFMFFFILQGMFGGKMFFLIASSVFFLCGSYHIVKGNLAQAFTYAIAYALFVQYFMWDRYIPLVFGMFATLLVPKLLLPFVSQVDPRVGRVTTIASGLVVFMTTQGFLLKIPFAAAFLYFIICVVALVFTAKARIMKETGH